MKKLVMLLILLSATISLFASDFTYEGVNYTIIDEAIKTCKTKDGTSTSIDNQTVITPGNSASGNLTIPKTVYNDNVAYTVQSIGDYSFAKNQITAMELPQSITNIGEYAFYNCADLKSITIPESVIKIGREAFYNCGSLNSIELPKNLKTIEGGCFGECGSLTSIKIPEGVTSIGEFAFSYCHQLANVDFPSTVTNIGYFCFGNCISLKTITCRAITPPHCDSMVFYFAWDYTYSEQEIHIPYGLKDVYASAYGWESYANYMIDDLPIILIEKSDIRIEQNETIQLQAKVMPYTTTNYIIWSSSDESVAKVSEAGLVTAMSPGKATIIASSENLAANCNVEVLPISVKRVELNATSVSLNPTEEFQLTATVKPDNAADKTVTWKSSDESVATVSETGLISAHSVGSAIITAQNGNVTGYCVVVVLPKHVTLDEKEITLEIGSTKQLTATVLPENFANKTVIWESSNPAVAEVSENGEVTALTSGVAVITATCGEGSAFCIVTVPEIEDATTMTLSIKLGVSKTLQLAAIISPEDAAGEVVWTSSNPEVADVSKDGVVSAKANGATVITATYGENTVNCIFDVDNDSSVNEIMSTENGEVSVYNLQGIKMNVSTREEFNKLSPGYYIVNNQVELIK